WLRGSRGGLLQRATRLDRPARTGEWDARQVRLLDPQTGQLLREHLRQARGRHQIKDEDRPRKTPLGTMQLLARAERAGSQIGVLCRGMHREHGEIAVRRIQGVLSLAKKYGVASVDDACAAASKWASVNTVLCGATWNGILNCH